MEGVRWGGLAMTEESQGHLKGGSEELDLFGPRLGRGDCSTITNHDNRYMSWILRTHIIRILPTPERTSTFYQDPATTREKGAAYVVTCNTYFPGSAKQMPHKEISAVSLIGLYHSLYAIIFAPDSTSINR
jgi:hypothetical protein